MAPLISQLLPSSLYRARYAGCSAIDSPDVSLQDRPQFIASPAEHSSAAKPFMRLSGMIPSAAEGKIELYTPKYYGVCAIGGALCCGLTHTAVTPLDVVKCNMQTNPGKFPSISKGFGITMKEGGLAGLVRGWFPTLVGYSVQGAGKFGLYEYFQKDLLGTWWERKTAHKYQTFVYLAGSASAEFFADIGLCPFEAVKVKVQTVPGWAKGLSDGLPKFVHEQGVAGWEPFPSTHLGHRAPNILAVGAHGIWNPRGKGISDHSETLEEFWSLRDSLNTKFGDVTASTVYLECWSPSRVLSVGALLGFGVLEPFKGFGSVGALLGFECCSPSKFCSVGALVGFCSVGALNQALWSQNVAMKEGFTSSGFWRLSIGFESLRGISDVSSLWGPSDTLLELVCQQGVVGWVMPMD
eukprot:jgi/Botrbrau1/13707/Bobra.250_2s0005.1